MILKLAHAFEVKEGKAPKPNFEMGLMAIFLIFLAFPILTVFPFFPGWGISLSVVSGIGGTYWIYLYSRFRLRRWHKRKADPEEAIENFSDWEEGDKIYFNAEIKSGGIPLGKRKLKYRGTAGNMLVFQDRTNPAAVITLSAGFVKSQIRENFSLGRRRRKERGEKILGNIE